MAAVFRKLQEGYVFLLFEENADPRTKDFFLSSSPLPVLAIVASYLYFCTVLGPRLMKHREPCQLKHVLLVYNAFQMFLSIYMCYLGTHAYVNYYNYFCQPVEFSYTPKDLLIASGVWWYFFAKITELLDTVFFVLRKKDSQITFLHLYHHSCMPLFGWLGVRYFASGHGVLLGWLNSIVHIFMYFYYLLSGLGPQFQKYLWWKKYITTIQLVQFVMIWCHNFFVIFSDCTFPKSVNILICIDSTVFLYMFGKFYISSYSKDNRRKAANDEEKLKANGKETSVNGIVSNGKEELLSNGKEKLLSNGKEVLLNGKENTVINGKESTMLHNTDKLVEKDNIIIFNDESALNNKTKYE